MVGWVIAEGRARGIPMPSTSCCVRQVKEIEAGTRTAALHNLDELEAAPPGLYGAAIGPR